MSHDDMRGRKPAVETPDEATIRALLENRANARAIDRLLVRIGRDVPIASKRPRGLR